MDLKHSALLLKEKIAAEKRLLELQGREASHSVHTSTAREPPLLSMAVGSGALPGVSRLDQHAILVEKQQKEDEAATTIQSVWRGHVARSTISHQLPPTAVMSVTTRVPHISISPACSSVLVHPPPSAFTGSVSAPSLSSPHLTSHEQPWKKGGGDSLSVINIFTSQQQKTHPLPHSQQETVPQGSVPVLTSNVCSRLSYTDTFEDDQSSDTESEETLTTDQEGSTSDHTPITQTQPTDSYSVLQDSEKSLATAAEEVHAITPPGSPSFHETFSASLVQQQQEQTAVPVHTPSPVHPPGPVHPPTVEAEPVRLAIAQCPSLL